MLKKFFVPDFQRAKRIAIACITVLLVIPTYGAPQATRNGTSTKAKTTIDARVTGYCNCYKCTQKNPGDTGYGICADGSTAATGTVAAPKKYPFGTKITIPSYNGGGVSVIHDRGGAITGDRFDAWFPSHQDALNWGIKNLTVTIGGTV